ncbi:uncharacterized protein ALTATR162_LOCUS9567 [Alternaria atra]|uniref:DUF4211 domain-containing protein n=1 Tax=Alternaria atra TaxID=119953 RepID=A0A8J2I7M5_9PLEO|nr:uncharacterized protein ALTATR162_LOCUS9567 [Alternaria atra]CAG5181048.1 unnamed protein product [Alternaria atra]
MAPKKPRDRKRQTKINFSPAPKSSPATKSSAATTMGTSPSRPNLTAMRPTKAPSRASKKNKQDFWGEDELAAGIKRGKGLGKLIGSTAHGMFDSSSSDSAGSTAPEEDEPPKLVESQMRRRAATYSESGSEDEEDEEDEVPVEEPKSRKRRRATTPSESGDEELTVTVIPRKRQRRVKIESDSSEKPKKEKKKDKKDSKRRKTKESTPEKEETQPVPRSSRRGAVKKATTPDEDDEEDEPLTPAPRSRRKTTRRKSPSAEEEEKEQSPPRSTRRRLKRRKSPSEDEEEPSATPEPAKRRSRGDAVSNGEDLDEADGSANEQEDNEEQDELKEELAFLRSSPLPDRGRLRSTQDKPKNKRQEALEALKRRRAGTTGTNEPSSSVTPGRKRAVVVDSDSESELEVIKEEPDSDLEILGQDDIEDDEQEESDRDANALDMFQEDQEDEQFIDDDPDNMIGEPSVNDDLDEMRLAFSLSRAKTRDLFKHAVEWMVMKKIHPGFDSNKNVYTLTFRKLDDEVKGLAGSKYTSSAWTADFTRAIRARPDLMINELSAAERAVMSPHCEACNRSNHTASFELLLQGQPYHPETLEPLANASDSSDSDSDDSDSSGLSSDSETALNGEKPTYNYQKDRIPPESHRFPLGSTCKANAQVAHTLYHWRYNLYQWVKDYLKAEGHLTAEKLVKRDGRSDRKRAKEARKIVDAMEADGQIRSLYHSYKTQLQAAVEADNDYANGWGRRG